MLPHSCLFSQGSDWNMMYDKKTWNGLIEIREHEMCEPVNYNTNASKITIFSLSRISRTASSDAYYRRYLSKSRGDSDVISDLPKTQISRSFAEAAGEESLESTGEARYGENLFRKYNSLIKDK